MATGLTAFERRFSAASLKELRPADWDQLIRTLDTRLRGIEEKRADFEAAEQLLISIGLARINEALLPAFQTITGLAHLGALLTAHSTTDLVVGTGTKQLTINEGDRSRFAPSAYLSIRASGQGSPVMTGYLVDFHRETGTLTVDVDQSRGEGGHDDWVVSAAAAPDFASFADIRGDVDESLNTLAKLAAAIGNDPVFAETVASQISTLTVSLVSGLSGRVPTSRQISVSGLAQGGGALTADRTINVPKATPADMRAGTNDAAALTVKAAYAGAAEILLTYANPLVIDFSAGTNFVVTLQGSPQIQATGLTNVAGKMGRIRFIQDGTGNHEPTWTAGAFVFAGGEPPPFSAAAGAEDIGYYDVLPGGRVLLALNTEVA